MEWITENAEGLTLIVTSLVTAASAIANFTSSDKDNKVVGIVSKIVNIFALNFGVKPTKKK